MCGHWMDDSIIEATCYNKEERDFINAQTTDEKKRAMVCHKVNRIYHKKFEHFKIDMPDGKVLHLRRTVGMNYAKDNCVNPEHIL